NLANRHIGPQFLVLLLTILRCLDIAAPRRDARDLANRRCGQQDGKGENIERHHVCFRRSSSLMIPRRRTPLLSQFWLPLRLAHPRCYSSSCFIGRGLSRRDSNCSVFVARGIDGPDQIEYARTRSWRRGRESNSRIKVLQTSPLPLGYRARGTS